MRFAGTDALIDRLRTFQTRVDRVYETRVPAIEVAKKSLDTPPPPPVIPVDPTGLVGPVVPEVSPEDRAVVLGQKQRIKTVLEKEEALLERTRGLVRRTLEAASISSERLTETTSLKRAIELEEAANRLVDELQRAEAVLRRAEVLAAIKIADVDSELSWARQWAEVERHRQQAEVLYAEAKALHTRFRARRARQHADEAAERFLVSGEELKAAEAEKTSLIDDSQRRLKEIDQARKALAPVQLRVPRGTNAELAERIRNGRKALRLARLELLAQQETLQKTRVEGAQTVLWAHLLMVDADRPDGAPPLTQAVVEARLDELEGVFASVESSLASLRDTTQKLDRRSALRSVLEDHRDVAQDQLGVLVELRQTLERANLVRSLVLRRQTETLSWGALLSSVLLSGLVLAIMAALLFWGPKLGHRWGERLPEGLRNRMAVIMTLVWPFWVLGTGAAILVWPVWGLHVTLLEAVRAVDHPLFYVDETSVSVFAIIKLVATVWLSVVLSRLIRDILNQRVYPRVQWDVGLTNAFNTLVHYVVVLLGVLLGLRFVGVGLSSLAIFAGVLGIGIGFGLRNITENFISGLIILAERPIKAGDFIEVKDGEIEGQVDSIRARSTTVVTRDNISVIIPNSEFVAQPVVNWSHGDPKVRISIPVGVAYGSDTDRVRKVLLEVANRHGQVLKKPGPEVQFRNFGSSSLDFLLLVWIDEQYHRFRIASDLHFAVDKGFRKHGIEIAFPQTDLHFRTVSEPFAAHWRPNHGFAEDASSSPEASAESAKSKPRPRRGRRKT